VRQPHPFAGGSIERVFVLSRITLGADVAVTSVALDAAKRRFPASEICLVGPEKNLALFASDSRIVPVVFEYGRSNLLRHRLTAGLQLREVVDRPASIVIDPDSRLTQLGLIPTCDDSRYHFFESRSYGGNSEDALPLLTAEWLAETFGVSDARPYLAPEPVAGSENITVSLGVGENLEKRVDDDFELQLLRFLLERSESVLLDRGAGGEEAERVNALVERLGQPANLKLHDGTYAAFASHILQSRLYVGYDSAGQHVAAAGDIPFVSIFKGFPCERMFFRWKPTGRSGRVIRVDNTDTADEVLTRTRDAIAEVAAGRLEA
jgi:ADP-heptose:LPS heptosyltransferase